MSALSASSSTLPFSILARIAGVNGTGAQSASTSVKRPSNWILKWWSSPVSGSSVVKMSG
jgi:hypothetical protein